MIKYKLNRFNAIRMTGEDIAWNTDKVKNYCNYLFNPFEESKIRPE